MKKVGIMGGTFNPIHYAHLALAEQAYRQFSLDYVLFMPSKHPPHKSTAGLASDIDRENMIKLAIDGKEYFKFSSFELSREGTTYTADTLRLLKEKNPDTAYYFIIGGDSLKSFSSWYRPEEILKYATIIAAGRDEKDSCLIRKQIEELVKRFSYDDFEPEILYMPFTAMNISSSNIRDLTAVGASLEYMLPEKVIKYIYDKELYKSEKINTILTDLSNKLSEYRYTHVLNVADTAVKLALIYGEDIVKAYIAGILHDCAKYMKSSEEYLDFAIKNNIYLSETERMKPNELGHSKIGAYIAEKEYAVSDIDILNAISYHTSGRCNMSMLEKIIFISDYTEPGRNFVSEPSLKKIRMTMLYDIDRAVLYELESVYNYFKSSGKEDELEPLALEAMEFYKKMEE